MQTYKRPNNAPKRRNATVVVQAQPKQRMPERIGNMKLFRNADGSTRAAVWG